MNFGYEKFKGGGNAEKAMAFYSVFLLFCSFALLPDIHKLVEIRINETKKIEEFSSLRHPCVKTKMIVKSKCEKLGRACMENDNSPVMPKITISVSDKGGGTVDCKAEYISPGYAN